MSPEERAQKLWRGKPAEVFLSSNPADHIRFYADVIREAVEEEREACAQLAREFITVGGSIDTRVIWTNNTAARIADAIRARSDSQSDNERASP